MKTILVTVAEFVENGGSLYNATGNRKLYYQNGIQLNIQHDELYKQIVEKQSKDYYVKIDCIPIYK